MPQQNTSIMDCLQAYHILDDQVFFVKDLRVLHTSNDLTCVNITVIVDVPYQSNVGLDVLKRYAASVLPAQVVVMKVIELQGTEFGIVLESQSAQSSIDRDRGVQ